jgi:hypothetical protein
MAKADITAQRLRELLDYNPETGIFTRLAHRCAAAPAGSIAGYLNPDGYTWFMVDRETYLAHRLAWLYMTGNWPAGLIDHINGVKTDNRIENLRDVSMSVNKQNARKARSDCRNSGGLAGAYLDRRYGGKWFSNITVSGRRKHLGYFDTPEEAHAAYLEAKRRLHAGCTI